jgi:hypothetical protein
MIHIVDTFGWEGFGFCPIDRQLPEPEDVRRALPKRAADLAVTMLCVSEEEARKHLRIGSTPNGFAGRKAHPWRIAVISMALLKHFDTMIVIGKGATT